MTDTPVRVGHIYTDHGGVDKYRTHVWKQEFKRRGIPVFNIDMEVAEVNVAYVSHPVIKSRYQRALQLHELGLPIVMQVDDDYARIPEGNRVKGHVDDAWDYLREIASMSKAVIVTTQQLAEYYEPYCSNVHIVPNYIPDEQVANENMVYDRPRLHRFGWAGSIDTHVGDLDVTGFAVRDLCLKGYEFHHIGKGKASPITNSLVHEHGGFGTEDYLRAIYDNFDVGIAPLRNIKFNRAKSALKVLEYSALGKPWVASPSRDYLRVHREYNIGLIAQKPRQWFKHIDRLLTDREFYNDHQRRAFEWSKTQVISKNYDKWLNAFESALKLDK